jgi:hypothetical protein
MYVSMEYFSSKESRRNRDHQMLHKVNPIDFEKLKET